MQDGYGFDGSSIRGFKAIDESDMLLIPDPSTAYVDPFFRIPTPDRTQSTRSGHVDTVHISRG